MKWLAALTILLASSTAFAQTTKLNTSASAKWKEECGSCHIAYPARFLAADNWHRLMNSLDKHFGANAELDAEDNKAIGEYLKHNAGKRDQRATKSLRISDSPWFKHEHDEVPSRAWTDPAVKSPANCTACHINATRGDWSEDGVRMPNGLGEEDEGEGDEGEGNGEDD